MRFVNADKLFNDMHDMCNAKAQFVMDFGEIVNVVDVLEQIMNASTVDAVDAVEVVRCRDCKNWQEWENGTGSCHRSENGYNWFGVDATDFCSFGERREDGEA